MNKLTIVILGTMFATALSPVLASAETWPKIDQSFYCTMQAPGDGGTYSTEALRANFNCVSAQTNALKNWIDAILTQIPLPTQTLPGLPPNNMPPVEVQEGIPTVPIVPCFKSGEFMTQACDERDIPVTQEGWRGEEVRVIQDYLKAEGSFAYPQSTGYFGPITRDAVKKFQTKRGLPSTGVVDKPTLEKMQSASSQVAPAMRLRINDLKATSKP